MAASLGKNGNENRKPPAIGRDDKDGAKNMAKGLNLKAIFSADTSNLKQGSKEATNAIKSFEKESSGALGSLAGAMGINIDQIKRFSEVGKGAGIAIANSFKNVNNEAKLISGSIAGIAVGVGALAVGAAVASWKELNKQADYFYQILPQ